MAQAQASTPATKQGRGRPAREPALKPAGVAYDAWRAVFKPFMERVLRHLDREEDEWKRYQRRLARAQEARADGEDVPLPAPPRTAYHAIRGMVPALPEEERAKLIAIRDNHRKPFPQPVPMIDHHGRVRVLPVTKLQISEWIMGEAVARGLACDYDSAYQMWLAQAELVLRDEDIGAIVAEVHPEKVSGRSPRMSPEDVDAANRDLARRERKRVNDKRKAFGYRAA